MQIIDQVWKEHLLAMDHLKDSVSLRGYAQRDPLQEYKKEAYRLFETMMTRIEDETALALIRMPPPQVAPQAPRPAIDESKITMVHPSAAAADSEASGGRTVTGGARGPSDDEILARSQSNRSDHPQRKLHRLLENKPRLVGMILVLVGPVKNSKNVMAPVSRKFSGSKLLLVV